MADFITIFHEDSDKLAKFTGFNLSDEDSLFEVDQTSKESAPSKNEDSTSRDDDVGDDLSISKTSISKSKQKKVISVSSISQLSLQSHKSNVKISALLYEITERTTQLAQPRSRVIETQSFQKPLKCGISKPTSRILELACPKVIHDSSTKSINFVSPSALKAIATQRIIELSQPRKNCNKDRHFKSLTRKKRIHRSNRNVRRMQKRLERGNKSELWKTRKQELSYYLNNTNSDRSIVIINLD
ncbi:hypothetical protein ACFW04_000610 [Cataglyphis niger]